MYGLEDIQTSFHAEFENNNYNRFWKIWNPIFWKLKERISPKLGENEQETVQNTEMGLLWKVAGSFSLKWEFVKMGIWTTFGVSKIRNGIPFYREHPVREKGKSYGEPYAGIFQKLQDKLDEQLELHGAVCKV